MGPDFPVVREISGGGRPLRGDPVPGPVVGLRWCLKSPIVFLLVWRVVKMYESLWGKSSGRYSCLLPVRTGVEDPGSSGYP